MGANCSNITYNDENLTHFVWSTMGQRCLSTPMMFVTAIFYSIILFMGICGNIFTCLVIARNNHMHTATNYYLFSLALSDLLTLILGLPFEFRSSVTTLWPDILPEILCKLRSTVTEMTSYASVLTITAFSIERWLAICFPLKLKIFSKLDRAVKVIFAIWVMAFLCATPVYVYTILNRLPLPENNTDMSATDDNVTVKMTDFCALEYNNQAAQATLINLSFWTFFVAPMLIISVLYTHIAVTINKASKETIKHDMKKLRRRKTVINMLVAVVVTFFICWSPFHIQRILTLYVNILDVGPSMVQLYSILFYVSGYFYYANAAVNPILYSVINGRFRRALLATLCFCVKAARQNTLRRLRNPMGRSPYVRNKTDTTPLDEPHLATAAAPNTVLLRRAVKYSSEVSISSTQADSNALNSSTANCYK